jgi:hypothetical protein
LAARLRAALADEQRRLRESFALLTELEVRLRTIESIESERLRRAREAMWFDWVRLKADHEFLRVHVGELKEALAEGAR